MLFFVGFFLVFFEFVLKGCFGVLQVLHMFVEYTKEVFFFFGTLSNDFVFGIVKGEFVGYHIGREDDLDFRLLLCLDLLWLGLLILLYLDLVRVLVLLGLLCLLILLCFPSVCARKPKKHFPSMEKVVYSIW